MPKGKKKPKTKKPKEEEERKGLRNEWILFIDEYMRNGFNGTKAYEKVYQVSYDVANASAPRLLANVSISEEIDHRLNASRVTDNFIIDGLAEIATEYRGAKTINAAVKAYEILGKVRGMLVDTKKFVFNGDNPANVPPVVPADRAKSLDGIIKGGGVIE